MTYVSALFPTLPAKILDMECLHVSVTKQHGMLWMHVQCSTLVIIRFICGHLQSVWLLMEKSSVVDAENRQGGSRFSCHLPERSRHCLFLFLQQPGPPKQHHEDEATDGMEDCGWQGVAHKWSWSRAMVLSSPAKYQARRVWNQGGLTFLHLHITFIYLNMFEEESRV